MSDRTTRVSLLDRLKDPHDDLAWREFERTYRDLILRYCHRRGLQHWDAEDVRQVVLLNMAKAVRRGFEYRPEVGRFRAYLGRVVRNSLIEHKLRPAATAPTIETDSMTAIPADEPEESDADWDAEWQDHHLRQAWDSVQGQVAERNLQIFRGLLEGRSIEHVAEEFDMSTQAVHKTKQRVRNLLRERIARQIREEDGVGG